MIPDQATKTIIQKAFPGMQEPEAAEMASSGEVRSYPANWVLCQENALEDVFYIILKGEVQVTKTINEAQVRTLNTLRTGDFFGEMALIHNAPRVATVRTIAPTSVLEINKATFDRILRQNTSVSLAMVREVSRRLRENDEMAIEDLRLKSKELAAAYQRLAEQDYARQEFLTTIAHELRTPLTAVFGYLQAIQAGKMHADTYKAAVDTITRNVKDIISLVNDILFLYELELILLDYQETDIGELVKKVVDGCKQKAKEGKVRITVDVAPDLPTVPADAKSLERVVQVLLDNSIKFSPNGGEAHVEVGYDKQFVWVRVSDTGVGIPPEAMPRLFRRFFRLDEVEGHLFSGAGLGLSIARQVVEQHGGKIDVQSQLGKGSVFTIKLPRK
jgi:signal transduction histidine kinase